MEKFYEQIIKILKRYFLQKQFEFRFDYYDGSEQNNEIYETNVVEYVFINQGTTLCTINNLELQPSIIGIPPSTVKMDIRQNEKDVTVYRYRFNNISSGRELCDAQVNFSTGPIIIGPCEYQLSISVNGNAVLPLITIDTTMNIAAIQAIVNANFVPFYGGSLLVTSAFPTIIQLVDFNFTTGDPMLITASVALTAGGCPDNPQFVIIPFTCEIVPIGTVNKLLVVSKMFGTVRTSNP